MALPGSASSVETYGMPTTPSIGFQNFQGIGKTDPTTDQDASEMNRELADLAQLTRTAPRARVRFATATTTGGMVLSDHDSMWGSGSSIAPTLSRVGTGHFRITWPSTVTDPLGNSGIAILLKEATANADGATFAHAQAKVTSANVVDVYTFDSSLAAADLASAAPIVVKIVAY